MILNTTQIVLRDPLIIMLTIISKRKTEWRRYIKWSIGTHKAGVP